jgi:hypothetical protein
VDRVQAGLTLDQALRHLNPSPNGQLSSFLNGEQSMEPEFDIHFRGVKMSARSLAGVAVVVAEMIRAMDGWCSGGFLRLDIGVPLNLASGERKWSEAR